MNLDCGRQHRVSSHQTALCKQTAVNCTSLFALCIYNLLVKKTTQKCTRSEQNVERIVYAEAQIQKPRRPVIMYIMYFDDMIHTECTITNEML